MDSTPFESAGRPPDWAVTRPSTGPGGPSRPKRPQEAEACSAFGVALAEVSASQAAVVDAAVDLVVEVRDGVLERKGLTAVELGGTAVRSVLAEVKRCAVLEVQVKAGYGVSEARTLVALALTSVRLREVLTGAMRRGEASWPLARRFWESSANLTDDQRHLVAGALFGTEEGIAVPERLGPDGQLLLGRAWSHDEFIAACDLEVTACEGVDVTAERERRRRAYAGRSTSMRLNDDGTGTLSVRGPAAAMAAVYQRVDKGARNARALGDERTLANLRCDLVSALLIYGTVDVPARDPDPSPPDSKRPLTDHHTLLAPGDPLPAGSTPSSGSSFDEIVAPEEMDRLVRVVNALPPVALQVVVPVDVLTPVVHRCPSCGETARNAPEQPSSAPPEDRPGGPSPFPDDPHERTGEESVPEWMQVLATWLPEGPGRGFVGEVLGPTPFALSPGLARELALTPGATLHRLVTDPVDGRCLERSARGYRPDADMRRQIHAADVYSRRPGSRTHAAACELDHVTPWG